MQCTEKSGTYRHTVIVFAADLNNILFNPIYSLRYSLPASTVSDISGGIRAAKPAKISPSFSDSEIFGLAYTWKKLSLFNIGLTISSLAYM
jgi:hypothetical protein